MSAQSHRNTATPDIDRPQQGMYVFSVKTRVCFAGAAFASPARIHRSCAAPAEEGSMNGWTSPSSTACTLPVS